MRSLRVLVFLPLGALQACTALGQVPGVNSEPVLTKSSNALSQSNLRLATPPPGFVAFCKRSPVQCKVAASAPAHLFLDEEIWETLEAVNTATNASVAPKADSIHYGVDEYWTIPTDGYGDCDDYVLAK